MEVNTPIALVCYERALPFPTSSPKMHNQLSNLTYLPKACEAHGTGRAVIQKVPIYKNLLQDRFSERLDFFSALTLDWRRRFRCVRGEHTHTRGRTPLHLLAHTLTQTKGRKRDQRKMKWPARVLMREGRASGIYLKPFFSPCCSLWRALSPPPVNGQSVDFLSNKG